MKLHLHVTSPGRYLVMSPIHLALKVVYLRFATAAMRSELAAESLA
jgi:hypothetical protein